MPPDRETCDGCGHAFHRDTCPRKGPSGCVPVLDPATGRESGIACSRGSRWPCPCPFGECHTCGAPIYGASTFPLDDGSPEIDIDRDSNNWPGGTLAIRQLPDGTRAVRRLAAGEEPGPGEWYGREHAHQLTALTATLTATRRVDLSGQERPGAPKVAGQEGVSR